MQKVRRAEAKQTLLDSAIQHLKKAFAYIALFSFCVNLLMLTVPIYMMQLFDRVMASHSTDTLIYLTLVAIFALITYATLEMARSRIANAISNWLDQILSPKALSRSADEVLQGRQYGSQALRDISFVRQFINSPALFALFDSPWVPLYLIVIFMLNPFLFLLAFLGAIILFTLGIINEIWTQELIKKSTEISLKIQLQTDSTIRNAEVIQAMGMMPNIIKNWYLKNNESLTLQDHANHLTGMILSISKFLRMALQLLMLALGAYLTLKDQLTSGGMIAGSILLSRALAPVEQTIGSWKQLQATREALRRLKAHFLIEIKRDSGITLPDPQGNIEITNLYYAPPGSEKNIIINLNLSIAAGETLAIIGPSAAGKSTLARLLVGAWPPNSGSIRLDSAEIFTWERTHFGKFVGYLPQDVELFSGTVKSNIARLGEANDEDVIAAAKLAGVHEMILHLPEGYETPVGTMGYSLSGGQRQRVALARALYGNPKLLILDEPNSNLDSDGEEALIMAVSEMKKRGATIIIIAHRPSILRVVDTIIVMSGGQIQFKGPRDEVMTKISIGNQLSPKSAANITPMSSGDHDAKQG